EPAAVRPNESVEGGDLVEHEVLDLVDRQIDLLAAKVRAIVVARMRADAHAASEGHRDRAVHQSGTAGVHAARDVAGREEGEERLVIATLADVRVQVDVHDALQAASASVSVTLTKRIFCPGLACAKRGKSAPMMDATRG